MANNLKIVPFSLLASFFVILFYLFLGKTKSIFASWLRCLYQHQFRTFWCSDFKWFDFLKSAYVLTMTNHLNTVLVHKKTRWRPIFPYWNGVSVPVFNWYLNTGTFGIKTCFDHLNTPSHTSWYWKSRKTTKTVNVTKRNLKSPKIQMNQKCLMMMIKMTLFSVFKFIIVICKY